MGYPVTISNVLRLTVKTTVAIVIRGVASIKDQYGGMVHHHFRYSSADPLTADVSGGDNYKYMPAFLEKSELLSVVLSMETLGVQPEECFINLDILPDANATTPIKQLISHYLTSLASISYPETPYESSIGSGGKDIYRVYSPLSGLAGGIFTVPTGYVIDVETLMLKIVPTAAAATQTSVKLFLRGQPIGSLDYFVSGTNRILDSALSNVWYLTFAKNNPASSSQIDPDVFDTLPIPGMKLFPGDQIRLETVNVNAALSSLSMRYKQWISPI